jgi:hypothetical protein
MANSSARDALWTPAPMATFFLWIMALDVEHVSMVSNILLLDKALCMITAGLQGQDSESVVQRMI